MFWLVNKYSRWKKTRRYEIAVGHPVRINWTRVSLCSGSRMKFGNHVICRGGLQCQKENSSLEILDRSFIGAGTCVVSTSQVVIGEDVLIAHDCYITDTDGHSLDHKIRKQDIANRWKGFKDWSVVESIPLRIENNSWIGPRATILKGANIGMGAVVCAGAVVTKPVEPFTVVAGVPAKAIRRLDP